MAANTYESDVMTLDELAARLDISLTKAYELAKEDRLPVPGFKVGREWRFSRPAYDKLIHRQHEGVTA